MGQGIIMAVAGLAGLAGVALSAVAAHDSGSPLLQTAALFLLVHAAALVGLAALLGGAGSRVTATAAVVLLLGLVLFSGDLVRRATLGQALFPMAAPTGGILLMLGWVLLVVAGLWRLRG